MAEPRVHGTARLVDRIITRELNRNSNSISNALIEPLSPDYPYSKNGIFFFCARMGGGKTFQIMRHIMITERLFDRPYYDTIIFTSTSGTLDKTVATLRPQVLSPITYVKDSDLLDYLKQHLRRKMKWYAMVELLKSTRGESIGEPNEIAKHIVEKHRMWKMMKGHRVYDVKRMVDYVTAKSAKYGFTNYPSNTLLVLDDFATNPLIKKVDSELVGLLTKTRHYHLTAIVVAQTWRFVQLNLKRLCTDIVIWKGFSEEDFKKMITQTPGNTSWQSLWSRYSNLTGKHAKMVVHCMTDEVEFEDD